MNVKIITDSGCDLPESLIEQYAIEVMPLIVNIDGQEYFDMQGIKAKELYSALREGKIAKTAQVPPAKIREVFQSYIDQNLPFLYIGLSSELSGTFQSAYVTKNELAEENPDAEMEVLDSKAASLGYGLMVLKAAQLAEKGLSLSEIKNEIASAYVPHMEHIFTVDDLDFLQRGGRVSKASAFVGGLLKIKPVLHVEDGKLVPIEKVRGRNKVFKRMVEIMEERGSNVKEQIIGISHGDDLESAEKLKELIKDSLGAENFLIHTVGATIGSHSGPGTIALFFLNK
ncbi:DegV family protein [Pseudalkalibacillus caeni]|uniref:DegV family protein n=1 Tax=Exobacillus caeni TaxID=2574798 RepID=A0A5R9FE05_9BACL|nr:DegV family protein [Pseudalkalibacillus caeni]TLS37855.1 DegV family protein [Pseudalkalibacillus caeni]